MKNLYRQNRKGYCTVCAIASMFGVHGKEMYDKFIKKERFYNEGCDDKDELEMMQYIDKNFAMAQVLSIRHNYEIALPDSLVWKVLTFVDVPDNKRCKVIPYLLSVRLLDTHQYWHSVVVFNIEGRIFYLDPHNENWKEVHTPQELYKNFLDVWEIKRPYRISDDRFLMLSQESIEFTF